jgi:hypothetical protein
MKLNCKNSVLLRKYYVFITDFNVTFTMDFVYLLTLERLYIVRYMHQTFKLDIEFVKNCITYIQNLQMQETDTVSYFDLL